MNMKTEIGTFSHAPTSQEGPTIAGSPLETRREPWRRCPLTAAEETNPAGTSLLDLQPPELGGDTFLLFRAPPPPIWGACHDGPGNQIHLVLPLYGNFNAPNQVWEVFPETHPEQRTGNSQGEVMWGGRKLGRWCRKGPFWAEGATCTEARWAEGTGRCSVPQS